MNHTLRDFLDIPRLRELLDTIDDIHGMPSAIMDLEGNILTATAWQDICVKFHRINPATEKQCIESDTRIQRELNKLTPQTIYRCPMGLVDAASPIIVDGEYFGKVYTGQVFLEPPDEEYFIKQAQKYGFDENGYLAAMRQVPLFTEEQLRKNLTLIHSLTQLLADQGMQHKKQLEVEKDLQEREDRYRSLFTSAGEGIFLLSTDGRLVEVNEAFARMHGYSTLDMQQMSLEDLDTPETSLLAPGRIRRLLTGEHLTFEVEHYHKDGRILPQEVSAKLISFGGNSYFQCFHRDISERKQVAAERAELEQQLQQTQRLESLGVLAGGIAHDFNNLLTVIIGNCSLAQLKPTNAVEKILTIETAAKQAAELCQQMLAYAGKANLSKVPIQLAELVNEMVRMSRSSVAQNVMIISDLAAKIPILTGDASQLRQITMNLMINAAEAIGESQGEVHVSLKKTTVLNDQQERDHLGAIIPPGRYACLEVTDNGCGMDKETRQRIFEPFFTTKFTGRGLGMAAVLGIIKAHQGALQVTSRQGQGTTFIVFLLIPSSETAAGQTSPELCSPESWQGKGTVLLVEDEEIVRCVAEEMLETLGFTVIQATNGQEALDLYQQHTKDIALVVTDIGMPIMDGYELFNKLKGQAPDLPIILSSGFGERVVFSRISAGAVAGFLSKPYSANQLREMLRSAVEVTKPAQT